MSFNEKDLYTVAIGFVKQTKFEPGFESRVVDLLRAAQAKDMESVANILNVDEEMKDDISEAASLAIIKAQTSLEENILATGSAEEIEVLNDLKESQLNFINSL